jgi:hypothetical protein
MLKLLSRRNPHGAGPAKISLSDLTDLFPILDPKLLQTAADEVLTTLNEPEFREEVKKTVELSYTTSLQILQRFLQLSKELPSRDKEQMTEALKESVPKLIKANLSMAIELLTLNQKYSSMLIDILEKSATKPRTESRKASSESDVRPRRR